MKELESLIRTAQAGDLQAFDELVMRFQDMAYGTAYGLVGRGDLAEEATQDALVEVFFSLPKLRQPAAFLEWFHVIVFRCCKRLTRGKQVHTVPLEIAADMSMNVSDPAEEHEVQGFVRDAVAELPEPERMVVALFYISGCSQKEIAAYLGVPVGTIKKRLYDARKRLKSRMVTMVKEYLHGQRPSRNEQFTEKVRRSIILFSADDRIYAMSPDGSQVKALSDPGHYTDCDFSPDGKKILYGAGDVVNGLVVARHYLMNVDGSDKQAFGPDWVSGYSHISPDGKHIVFTSHKDHPNLFPEFNRAELYIMAVDGANVLRLTRNEVEDNAPTWTPDGKILFARDVSGKSQRFQLFLLNTDGMGETGFPPGGPETFGNWPVFSPDGKRIAFVCWNNMHSELWVMDADGANQVQLAAVNRIHAPPSWSQDGRQIVFAANHQLYIVNADGSSGLKPAPVRMKRELKGINCPVWSR